MTVEEQFLRESLIGESLVRVSFVMDYQILDFGSCSLTVTTECALVLPSGAWRCGQTGFADGIVGPIGSKVAAIDCCEGEVIGLVFEEGRVLNLSLKPDDYHAAEAVVMQRKDGQWQYW